jgi:hypothetical protein
MVGPIPTDRINSLSSVIRVHSRYSREALCISPADTIRLQKPFDFAGRDR